MTYPGGKSGAGIYQTIINQIPPHELYIEPFLGGGAILRYKKPARSSIAIDRDDGCLHRFALAFPGDLLPGVTYVCDDAISWLSTHLDLTQDYRTFIYLDPPYLMETRSCQCQIYRWEMTKEDHAALLFVIMNLTCSIAISGYESWLYNEALLNWRRITFKSMTRGGRQAVECLWMNYPEPYDLHDYRYLGANYRERERIKRRQQRWFKRLSTMNNLERYAMLSVVDQLRDHTTISNDSRSNPDPTNRTGDAPAHDHSAIFDGNRSPATIAIPSEERSKC